MSGDRLVSWVDNAIVLFWSMLLWRDWQKILSSSVLRCYAVCSVRVPDVSKERRGFLFRIKQSERAAILEHTALVYIFYCFERLRFLHNSTLMMEILRYFQISEILYPETERCISEKLNLKTTALWEYQISKATILSEGRESYCRSWNPEVSLCAHNSPPPLITFPS